MQIDARGRWVAKNPIERFFDMVIPEPNSGCWLWTGHISKTGYGQFRIDPKKIGEPAHRASVKMFKGQIPNGLFVCHKCDVRECVNPDHMFLGTAKDNMSDASKKGRMNWKAGERRNLPTGEKHTQAKLKSEDIRDIRRSKKMGVELAKEYGVSPVTISRIRRFIIWRDEH